MDALSRADARRRRYLRNSVHMSPYIVAVTLTAALALTLHRSPPPLDLLIAITGPALAGYLSVRTLVSPEVRWYRYAEWLAAILLLIYIATRDDRSYRVAEDCWMLSAYFAPHVILRRRMQA